FHHFLVLPNGTTVIPRCSFPPGAESTFLNYLREEVCGPSSKTHPKHPPLRQFKRQHHRLSHSTHPRRRALAVQARASLPVWVPAWRSRDISSARKTCRSTVKWTVPLRSTVMNSPWALRLISIPKFKPATWSSSVKWSATLSPVAALTSKGTARSSVTFPR